MKNQSGQSDTEFDVGASPSRIVDPDMRREAGRAFVWVGVVGIAVLAVYISQSLLVIFGAMVFAAMIDGGARLLGRVLPIGRGWRVALVLLFTTAFLAWLGYFAGSQISQQAAEFPAIVTEQLDQLIALLRERGFAISQTDLQGLASQLASGASFISSAIGGVFGAADLAADHRHHRYLRCSRAAPL